MSKPERLLHPVSAQHESAQLWQVVETGEVVLQLRRRLIVAFLLEDAAQIRLVLQSQAVDTAAYKHSIIIYI